jgi:hypothetical protein
VFDEVLAPIRPEMWTIDIIKPQPWWKRLYRYLFYPKYTQHIQPTVIVPHD